MWAIKNRNLHNRSRLRYPGNLTDEEWALIEPPIPPAKRGGAKAFMAPPTHWIVERTIGRLNRCRRLAKDRKCLNRNALAFLR